MRVAVVGGGIAGLGAAWSLSRLHDVTIFEAGHYAGGHANTVVVDQPGGPIGVDTGFIVYNEENYPNLTRLFAELGVETQPSDMSFGVSINGGALEYEGSLRGLIAQPSNLLKPGFHRMCRDIRRFWNKAPRVLHRSADKHLSLGDYLRREQYSDEFVRNHLLPMGAAIWSCSFEEMASFPIESFVRFFCNHGLLSLNNRPAWRTVSGGSREYVRRLTASFKDRIYLNTAVLGLQRRSEGVYLQTWVGWEGPFDSLVMATHADQALTILGSEATELECAVLGRIRYSSNRAVLHQDDRLMPKRRAAWASWNYLTDGTHNDTQRVSVTYWMNRLQNIDAGIPLFVSLNPLREPDPETVLGEYTYEHPILDQSATSAQGALHKVQGQHRTWFCGSYAGFGFHEDALQSGLSVAAALGSTVPWMDEVSPASPAAFTVPIGDYAEAAE
mgnify:CR=1 FL=1|tara:strand:- start:3779 stop:5110 length:1332 start_codon:yes stop_codon:yes gene_type:complete